MFEYLRWWSCSWKVLFSRCGKCKYTVCLETNSANLISQLDPCQGWLTYQYMSCHISVSGELQNMTSYYIIYIYTPISGDHHSIIYYSYIIDPFKYICPKCLSIKLWVAISHVPKMSRLLGLVCEHLAWSGMPSRPWHAMTGTPFKDEMNGGRNDYLNCRTKGILIFKNRWVMFEHGMLFLTAFMDS